MRISRVIPTRRDIVLIFCLVVLFAIGLKCFYLLNEVKPLGLAGVTGLSQRDEGVSLTLDGSNLTQNLPAYLSLDAANRRAIVGNLPVAGSAIDIQIVNQQAFIESQLAGVKLYDLSDPSKPAIQREIFGPGQHVWHSEVDEGSLYLSSWVSGLLIYSLPYNKQPPHRIFENAIASAHRGRHIFIASGNKGLSIFEYSKEVKRSRPLARLALPGFTLDLAVFGDFLVTASMKGGLHLIDISDPENPQLVQTVTGQKQYETLWVADDILYASDRDRQLDIFRLAEKRLNLVGQIPLVGRVRGYDLKGTRLYISEASYGVSVLDVRDPEHPHRIGFVGTSGEPRGLALYGDYLYVASSSQGVQIVDTRLIEPINLLASIDTPINALDLVLDGPWLYAADGFGGLQVIDRSDLNNLKFVANFPTLSSATALVKTGDIVFVLIGSGLIGVDVSDPLQPKMVCQLALDIRLSDLAVRGSTLFVSSYDEKLLKIDISDPSQPQVTETVDLPGRPHRIALSGADVFIAAEKSGLLVVHFSPDQPGELIGILTRPWPMSDFSQAVGIAVRDGLAYLIQGEEGLQIIDIRHPEKPKETAFIPLPGMALSLSLSEAFAVVATRWNGYYFIDISQPGNPQLAANLYFPRSNGKFKIEGDRLYTTGHSNGINVLPLPVKNIGASGTSRPTLKFNNPQFPGWYDLSVSGGKKFVTAPSALKIE